MSIEDKVLETARDIPVFDDATLHQTPFESGGDILDFIDLVVKLEVEFDVEIPDEELENEEQVTFKDLAQAVKHIKNYG